MQQRTGAVDHDRRVRVGTRFLRCGRGCLHKLRLVVGSTVGAAEDDVNVLVSACPHDSSQTSNPFQP
jgi:hypothetical protein